MDLNKRHVRDHSARATIPSSGWIATRLVCVAGSLGRRMVRDLAPVSGETNGARHNKRVLPLLN